MRLLSLGWSKSLAAMLAVAMPLLCSCSSAKINFQSGSGVAEVWVAPIGSKDLKIIGSTPLTISSIELAKKIGEKGPVAVEYRSSGFTTQRAIITDSTNVDINLSLEMIPLVNNEDPQKMNRVVDRLFEVQRLARVGRAEDALQAVKEIQKEAPYVTAAYELEGGIYLMQKKYEMSLDAYRTASKLDPKNLEIANMKKQVEKLASGGAP